MAETVADPFDSLLASALEPGGALNHGHRDPLDPLGASLYQAGPASDPMPLGTANGPGHPGQYSGYGAPYGMGASDHGAYPQPGPAHPGQPYGAQPAPRASLGAPYGAPGGPGLDHMSGDPLGSHFGMGQGVGAPGMHEQTNGGMHGGLLGPQGHPGAAPNPGMGPAAPGHMQHPQGGMPGGPPPGMAHMGHPGQAGPPQGGPPPPGQPGPNGENQDTYSYYYSMYYNAYLQQHAYQQQGGPAPAGPPPPHPQQPIAQALYGQPPPAEVHYLTGPAMAQPMPQPIPQGGAWIPPGAVVYQAAAPVQFVQAGPGGHGGMAAPARGRGQAPGYEDLHSDPYGEYEYDYDGYDPRRRGRTGSDAPRGRRDRSRSPSRERYGGGGGYGRAQQAGGRRGGGGRGGEAKRGGRGARDDYDNPRMSVGPPGPKAGTAAAAKGRAENKYAPWAPQPKNAQPEASEPASSKYVIRERSTGYMSLRTAVAPANYRSYSPPEMGERRPAPPPAPSPPPLPSRPPPQPKEKAPAKERPPPKPAAPRPSKKESKSSYDGPPNICMNCATQSTPLWRKDKETGQILCNACGIYLKTHKRHRPVENSKRPNQAGLLANLMQQASQGQAHHHQGGGSAGGGGGSGGAAAAAERENELRRKLMRLVEDEDDLDSGIFEEEEKPSTAEDARHMIDAAMRARKEYEMVHPEYATSPRVPGPASLSQHAAADRLADLGHMLRHQQGGTPSRMAMEAKGHGHGHGHGRHDGMGGHVGNDVSRGLGGGYGVGHGGAGDADGHGGAGDATQDQDGPEGPGGVDGPGGMPGGAHHPHGFRTSLDMGDLDLSALGNGRRSSADLGVLRDLVHGHGRRSSDLGTLNLGTLGAMRDLVHGPGQGSHGGQLVDPSAASDPSDPRVKASGDDPGDGLVGMYDGGQVHQSGGGAAHPDGALDHDGGVYGAAYGAVEVDGVGVGGGAGHALGGDMYSFGDQQEAWGVSAFGLQADGAPAELGH